MYSTSEATDIYIDGSDIYIAGNESMPYTGSLNGRIWKNGELRPAFGNAASRGNPFACHMLSLIFSCQGKQAEAASLHEAAIRNLSHNNFTLSETKILTSFESTYPSGQTHTIIHEFVLMACCSIFDYSNASGCAICCNCRCNIQFF